VAERSITAVRNTANLLPLSPQQKVLSIVYADDYDPWTGRSFQAGLAAVLPGMRRAMLDRTATPAALDSLLASVEPNTVVLFSPYIRVTANKGSVALPAHIADFVKRTASTHPLVLTTFGNPYVLMQFPEVSTYVVAWGQWDVLQRAAARALTGQVGITGRLPIAIPPLHKLGEGLQIPVRGGTRE
jgi:beta-N-acetylhexosaminidase